MAKINVSEQSVGTHKNGMPIVRVLTSITIDNSNPANPVATCTYDEYCTAPDGSKMLLPNSNEKKRFSQSNAAADLIAVAQMLFDRASVTIKSNPLLPVGCFPDIDITTNV